MPMKAIVYDAFRAGIVSITVLCISPGTGSARITQTHSAEPNTPKKAAPMSKQANGTFEVKLNVQTDEKVGDPTVGRMSIDKQFHGDLEATSKGQMLAAMTDVKGSAGYVDRARHGNPAHSKRCPQRQLRLAALRHHDPRRPATKRHGDRKSTRLNSS